jgi:hypothetical protein
MSSYYCFVDCLKSFWYSFVNEPFILFEIIEPPLRGTPTTLFTKEDSEEEGWDFVKIKN